MSALEGGQNVADIRHAAKARQTPDAEAVLTEDLLALDFATFHPDWRWVQEWGKWLRWNDEVWEIDKTLSLFTAVREFVREEADLSKGREALNLGSAKMIASLERLCKSDPRFAATSDQWDQDLWLLNTPGGVIDLKTGELGEHNRELHMTKVTAVGPGNDCSRWMEFLGEITDQNVELIDFLQRMAGYSLTAARL